MGNNHVVTVSRVLHPNGTTLALEIVANDGAVYFVAPANDFRAGLRVGHYPCGANGPLQRVEIERLEQNIELMSIDTVAKCAC